MTAMSADIPGASSSSGRRGGRDPGGSNLSPSHAVSGEGSRSLNNTSRSSPARVRMSTDIPVASSSPGVVYGTEADGSNLTPSHASRGEGSRSTKSRKRRGPPTDSSEAYAHENDAAGTKYSLVYVIGA